MSHLKTKYDQILDLMFNHFQERLKDETVFTLRELNTLNKDTVFDYHHKKKKAYELFTKTVKDQAPWDYKPSLKKITPLYLLKNGNVSIYGTNIPGDSKYIYDYDIWSNIHYGYAGMLSGLSSIELIGGAKKHDISTGLKRDKQIISSTGHISLQNTFSMAMDMDDTNAVILGIRLYEKYGTNLTKQDLENEIFNNRHLLNRHLRSQLIEKRHIVQKGDTVIGLAAENNIRPEEIMRKYPFMHPSKPLPVGAIIEMPSPDEIKMMTEEDRREKMMCDAYLKQKSGAEHDAAVQEVKEAYECAEKYKALVQKTEDALKKESPKTPTKTAFYIWKTTNDSKVRTSHWERDGRVFSWANPPEGGHPGEDFNCRCHAVAYPSL